MNGKISVSGLVVMMGVASLPLVTPANIVYDVNGSGTWADTTRWVGGQVPQSGDWVDIPAGDVEVNDADVTVFNRVKINMTDGASRLIFRSENVGTPVRSSWAFTGTGTVVKASSRTWEMYEHCPGYTGDWDIQKGEVKLLYDYSDTMGPTGGTLENPPAGRIYIRNGAYLNPSQNGMTPGFTFGAKEIHLAGQFSPTIGVVHFPQWAFATTNLFGNVILEDDIYLTTSEYGVIGFGGKGVDNPGRLDLNGHSIHLAVYDGRTTSLYFENLLVTNSSTAVGTINVGVAAGGYAQRLKIHGNVAFAPNVTINQINKGQVEVFDSPGNHTLPIAANLSVGGSVAPIKYYNLGDSGSADVNRTTWAGNVTIGSTSVLQTLGLDTADSGAFFSGVISGNGNIVVDKDSGCGQLILGEAAPDFSGTVTINGRETFCSVKAMKPGFVRQASDVTVNGSTLVVAMRNWSLAQYMGLLCGVNYSNAIDGTSAYDYISAVTIDPKGCPDDTYTLSLSDDDGYSIPAAAALGVAGEGTVVVDHLPSSRLRFAAFAGTLKFTGDDPIMLGETQAASFAGGVGDPEILFDGAKDVDVASKPIYIGAAVASASRASCGRVTVRNSRLYNHMSDTFAEREGFEVGCNGSGSLVCENSAVTNRLHMGVYYGVGSLLLKSGRFCAWGGDNGATGENKVTKVGDTGHGYVENDGGDFCSKNNIYLGFDGGTGVFVQKRGSLVVAETNSATQAQLFVGEHVGANAARSVGQYWQKGGTGYSCFSIHVAGTGSNGSAPGTVGTFTLDGEGTVFKVQDQMVYVGQGAEATGVLNLNNGGRLMSKVICGAASDNGAVSTVNFDGGVFQYTGWAGGLPLFGSENFNGSRTTPITHVVVGERGGQILSSSSQANIRIGRPLLAPTGNGVASVPWTETDRTFDSCPAVIIDGDGWGASAMADYDLSTKTVRGIVVTSRGCDYRTAPVARLRIGQREVATATCTLSANGPDGGMTFQIADIDGSLIFDQPNTYRGTTVFKGGSCGFIVENADAFSCSSSLKLMGGILKLGAFTLADLGTQFKFMGGRISGDAATYVIPEGTMVVDLKDILAGEQYTVANNTNLTLPSSIAILNGDSVTLDEKAKYVLLTLPPNYSGPVPAFTGVPANWHVSRTATGFRMSRDRGVLLIVR